MRSTVLTLVFLFCFAIPGFAAGEEASKEKGSFLQSAAAEAVRSVSLQANDAALWREKVDAVRAKRNKNVKLMFVGVGVGSVLPLITAKTGSPKMVLLSGFGGVGIIGYGGYNVMKAANELEGLMLDGRQKGYVSIVPTDGGARMAMNFSF